MVEEEAYYRYTRDHSQRQTHPGESRVDMARMSWAQAERGRERENGERGTRYNSQETKGIEGVSNQNGWIIQKRADQTPGLRVQDMGWGMAAIPYNRLWLRDAGRTCRPGLLCMTWAAICTRV